ncbi:MAG: hypothetical protein AAGN35_12510 [Bacteroidota bacterium]
MAGEKYKLKITNIGVGDPFILFQSEFIGGGEYTLPSATPIDTLELALYLCGGGNCTEHNIAEYPLVGQIEVKKLSTDGPYFFGLPFDALNYNPGETLYFFMNGVASGSTLDFEGGSLYANADGYLQRLNYEDAPRNFQNITVYYDWAL